MWNRRKEQLVCKKREEKAAEEMKCKSISFLPSFLPCPQLLDKKCVEMKKHKLLFKKNKKETKQKLMLLFQKPKQKKRGLLYTKHCFHVLSSTHSFHVLITSHSFHVLSCWTEVFRIEKHKLFVQEVYIKLPKNKHKACIQSIPFMSLHSSHSFQSFLSCP
jgi:hypothetical protein